ncbi:divalent-cation tolerance protein CutA [Candidatus Binatia bacterium]|nr:divalent-cation tolerance protein CutA [Candidatus Binatia bacterium]
MEHSADSAPVLVVLTTVANEDDAARLATALVERRLVACVNVLPGVRSIYRWQGAVQDDRELLLLAKTTAARLDDVTAALTALHPYEVPEIVALEAASVAPAYAAWLRDAVGA